MLTAATEIERRLRLPLAAALTLSNVNGIVTVTIFLAYLLPLPALEEGQHALETNLYILLVTLAVTLPAAAFWTLRLWRPVHRWLASGAPAGDRERELVVHSPARVLRAPATLWALAAVLFTAVNATYSPRLALAVGIAITLGGLGAGIFAYLAVQRILRPVTALALTGEAHDHPGLPGISWRIMLTWGLGTGVPVLGIILVGAGILAGFLPASSNQMAGTGVFLGATALLTGLGAMWIGTRSLSEPLQDLRAAMDEVRRGRHSVRVSVYDGSEIGQLQAGFNEMVAGLEEREELRDLFGRQVGSEVAEQALERGPELGGEELEVAVLFCDLVGSTRLAADRPPSEVVDALNGFFAVIVEEVAAEGGTVNKFLGDAGLCIFGAPLPHPDPAGAALRAALGIRERLATEPLGYDAGIGVSTGRVVAGNVGTAERFEYTVIGDAVNEAARLTDLAKRDKGRILVAESVVGRALREHGTWSRAGRQRLRGRADPTVIMRPSTKAGAGRAQRRSMPAVSSRPHCSRSDGGGT